MSSNYILASTTPKRKRSNEALDHTPIMPLNNITDPRYMPQVNISSYSSGLDNTSNSSPSDGSLSGFMRPNNNMNPPQFNPLLAGNSFSYSSGFDNTSNSSPSDGSLSGFMLPNNTINPPQFNPLLANNSFSYSSGFDNTSNSSPSDGSLSGFMLPNNTMNSPQFNPLLADNSSLYSSGFNNTSNNSPYYNSLPGFMPPNSTMNPPQFNPPLADNSSLYSSGFNNTNNSSPYYSSLPGFIPSNSTMNPPQFNPPLEGNSSSYSSTINSIANNSPFGNSLFVNSSPYETMRPNDMIGSTPRGSMSMFDDKTNNAPLSNMPLTTLTRRWLSNTINSNPDNAPPYNCTGLCDNNDETNGSCTGAFPVRVQFTDITDITYRNLAHLYIQEKTELTQLCTCDSIREVNSKLMSERDPPLKEVVAIWVIWDAQPDTRYPLLPLLGPGGIRYRRHCSFTTLIVEENFVSVMKLLKTNSANSVLSVGIKSTV